MGHLAYWTLVLRGFSPAAQQPLPEVGQIERREGDDCFPVSRLPPAALYLPDVDSASLCVRPAAEAGLGLNLRFFAGVGSDHIVVFL
jgi:hypothetical protein